MCRQVFLSGASPTMNVLSRHIKPITQCMRTTSHCRSRMTEPSGSSFFVLKEADCVSWSTRSPKRRLAKASTTFDLRFFRHPRTLCSPPGLSPRPETLPSPPSRGTAHGRTASPSWRPERLSAVKHGEDLFYTT